MTEEIVATKLYTLEGSLTTCSTHVCNVREDTDVFRKGRKTFIAVIETFTASSTCTQDMMFVVKVAKLAVMTSHKIY